MFVLFHGRVEMSWLMIFEPICLKTSTAFVLISLALPISSKELGLNGYVSACMF